MCNISPPGPIGVPLNLCVWDPKKVDLFFPEKRSRGEYLSKNSETVLNFLILRIAWSYVDSKEVDLFFPVKKSEDKWQ